MATGDLITIDDYLKATGQLLADLEQVDQDQINWQIAAVSDAIRTYTDRDFTLNADAIQDPRTFRYEGGEMLEIDDATTVNSLTLKAGPSIADRVLDPTEWFAGSYGNPDGVLDTVELFTIFPRGISPQMGFRYNLDTIGWFPYPILVEVDAVWGWPTIPPKVKQAAVLAVKDFASDQDEYNSETIASYSHSRTASRSGTVAPTQALPAKAIALLDAYTRLNV